MERVVPDGVALTLVVGAMTLAQVLVLEAPHQQDIDRPHVVSRRERRAALVHVAAEVGIVFKELDL